MNASETDDLITIGVFARASGLTPSALRFYDDCGLLAPAYIDPATGYRYYAGDQCERASLLRRLREIAVPLEAVTRILSADADEAVRLLDEHVRLLRERADTAAALAASLGTVLAAGESGHRVTLSGITLADAVDQVVPAAGTDHRFPVLTGVLIEVGDGAVVLTATDRYRLTTRSLAAPVSGAAWAVVVPARDLAALTPWLRDRPQVALRRAPDGVVVAADGDERRLAAIDDGFPDYRAMLSALPAAATRAIVPRDALLAVVEDASDARVHCTIRADGVRVLTAEREWRLNANVTGPAIEMDFASGTLRAALATAVGPDVMLDISRADMPVVIRSATAGDLTTLAMPVAP
ncbi:MerR family transcriptional regulator [Prescottella agglutinans]|uniref:DNA polymerase III subunit beta family protein n=1 Tax=Prescottella agglutinans TaxID=1644129 RepID=UPI003D97909F